MLQFLGKCGYTLRPDALNHIKVEQKKLEAHTLKYLVVY